MEVFRKHKIAVWLLTIIFSILIFTLGVIIAQEPVYESDPFNLWEKEFIGYTYDGVPIVVSLMIITALLGIVYFITRPKKSEYNN